MKRIGYLVLAAALAGCAGGKLPPLSPQQQAAMMAGACLTQAMALPSLACTTKYQDPANKQTATDLATCMAAAQVGANAACGTELANVMTSATTK